MGSDNFSAGIIGVGSSLPEKRLTNFDLEKMVDTTNEWIVRRTGISERRILDDDTPAHQMGVNAAKSALENAGLNAKDLDLIIVSTEAPDYLTPSSACMIQGELKAKKAAAFDLNAACSGFVYSLTVAEQFIKTGYYRYIMVVGCEGLSRIIDWKDRNTCVLLGDGAGAAVVGRVEKDFGIIATNIGAEGDLGRCITIPSCFMNKEDIEKRPREDKRVMWMDGSTVLKFAVRAMARASLDVIKKAGLKIEDIDMVVPHQANIRIIEGAARRMGIDKEKVYVNLQRFGNISSACIPVAVDEAVKNNQIKKGDNLVLVGFGGGLTWASALLRWAV